MPTSAPAAASKFESLVSKYRHDHRNPVNHVLHVAVGWPMVAAALLLLPFRPLWSLGLFLGGYALMFTGHFVFEKNIPTILKHPGTPFVIAWSVIRQIGAGFRAWLEWHGPGKLEWEERTMATVTRRVGPADHGQRMTLDEFSEADFEEGWLYELARGVVIVTEVPGISHGRSVGRTTRMFVLYDEGHPGFINYRAGGGECRLRLPGMQSDRHPDQAVYLLPPPEGPRPWTRWVPEIVVEILSAGSEERDLVEKREEYLRIGVTEYWILDPESRRLIVLQRAGDVWQELVVPDGGSYRPHLLPGLEVRPAELLGPIEDE